MSRLKRDNILDNMVEIGDKVDAKLDKKTQERENITYYNDFKFGTSGLAAENVYIVGISNQKQLQDGDKKENINTIYEIYDKDGELIAKVTEDGKIHFSEEYLEQLRSIDERQLEQLYLYDIEFELPKELDENDIVMTKEELQERKYEQREKQGGISKKEEQEQKDKEEEKPDIEGKQEKEIAKAKGIPTSNVLKVKENSNLYKDHPNLEKDLYFYRAEDGVVRAEYIDENGNSQPSRYFEDSTTAVRQETIEMGDDGNPVTREVPYQVMRTNGLAQTDKDVRDVRININIDAYGYLEISEARQGMNGMWAAHDIEVKGRNYNSHALNEETSIRTRRADPDKQTDAYEQVENTGLVQDGIQYSEMYLISHSEEIIQEFIDEGYNKDEAVRIFDLMIGEEALTEEEAKARVNEEIKERQEEKLKEKSKYEKKPWDDFEEGGRSRY